VTNVAVNQQVAPATAIAGSGATGGSASWYQLGASTYTVGANGTLTVELSNAGANGYVVGDAVMIVDPPTSGAVKGAVVQGSSAKAADAVFAALAQSPSGTTSNNSAGNKSEPWWLLYGQD
jgi:flavin-dependent dehydrogenase